MDTLATVTLNKKKLGKTNNAFRTWKFDVKDVILSKPSELNTLTITFNSSFKYAQSQQKIWSNISLPEMFAHVRKPAFHFGWDWAANLNTCGITKPVYLRGHSSVRIESVQIRNSEVDVRNSCYSLQKCTVMIHGKIELSGEKDYTNEILKLEIFADGAKV